MCSLTFLSAFFFPPYHAAAEELLCISYRNFYQTARSRLTVCGVSSVRHFLYDAPTFLIADVGAVLWLPFLRVGRGGVVARNTIRCFLRVAVLVMLMDAVCHFNITLVHVLVSAGRSRFSLGVAAIRRMLGVVLAQAICVSCNLSVVWCLRIGVGRRGTGGKQHCTAEQQAQQSFSCSRDTSSLSVVVSITFTTHRADPAAIPCRCSAVPAVFLPPCSSKYPALPGRRPHR